MVERVLILTTRWLPSGRKKMATKFDVLCARLRRACCARTAGLWSQPRVIASIATARRPEHRRYCRKQQYDLVIVDEAHTEEPRDGQWQLVDGRCQKRFLLLSRPRPYRTRWWSVPTS